MSENNLYEINKKLGDLRINCPVESFLGNACDFKLLKKFF